MLVTYNGVFYDHAALYISRGSGSGRGFLYDPAGTYASAHGGGLGGYIEDEYATILRFIEYHKNDSTEKVCKDTTLDEEKRLVELIIYRPSPGIATCAINLSDVLSTSPYFPNVKPGTFWPGNLFRDAKKQ